MLDSRGLVLHTVYDACLHGVIELLRRAWHFTLVVPVSTWVYK